MVKNAGGNKTKRGARKTFHSRLKIKKHVL